MPLRPPGDPAHRLPPPRRAASASCSGRGPFGRARGSRRRRRRDAARGDRRVARATRARRGTDLALRLDPCRPGRGPHHRPSRCDRGGQARRVGPGLGHPLRRPRRHCRHPVRVHVRSRDADAAPHRVRCGARRPLLADRPSRLLARPRHPGLDGGPGDAQLRDDRDRGARAPGLPDRSVRHRHRRVRRRVPVGRHRRRRPRLRARHGHAGAGRFLEPATPRRRSPRHHGASRGRHRRRRGVASLRPRRGDRLSGQPRRARGPVGDRLAPTSRVRHSHPPRRTTPARRASAASADQASVRPSSPRSPRPWRGSCRDGGRRAGPRSHHPTRWA